MKRTKIIAKSTLVLLLVCSLVFAFASCKDAGADTDVWENAKYSSQTELGEGEKTLVVEVTADEKTVTFTVNTDCTTVGEALLECGLIAGEEGQYGLYVKEVNGIVADYDVDGYYWGFYKGGEFMLTGVDGTAIVGGESFELVREK